MDKSMHANPYPRLLAMTVLSFIAMYVLMYAMVDRFENVLANYNQFYMAGLMAAPMALIELALMGSMYPNRKLNAVLAVVVLIAAAAFWFGIREQAGIGDRQFVKSMIPHHAGAVLMCEQAPIADPELRSLCKDIVASQQAEIRQMKAILARLDE